VAWQSGNGALANVALDRALAEDANYSMAMLLRQVIDSGAPPSLARLPMTPDEVAASYDTLEARDEDGEDGGFLTLRPVRQRGSRLHAYRYHSILAEFRHCHTQDPLTQKTHICEGLTRESQASRRSPSYMARLRPVSRRMAPGWGRKRGRTLFHQLFTG
jgi:Domain of unknown function (DUF4192)